MEACCEGKRIWIAPVSSVKIDVQALATDKF